MDLKAIWEMSDKEVCMPVTHVIDKDRRIVFVTGRGDVSNADVIEAYRRNVSDPDFDPSFDELIDTSEIVRLDLKSGGIRSYIAI